MNDTVLIADVDIREWNLELLRDEAVGCILDIPKSLDREIAMYNDQRLLSGLTKVSKPLAVLHLCKIGLDNIDALQMRLEDDSA